MKRKWTRREARRAARAAVKPKTRKQVMQMNKQIHHKDFNRKNNDPNNTIELTEREHIQLHVAKRRLRRLLDLCEYEEYNKLLEVCRKMRGWTDHLPKTSFRPS